MLRGRTNIGIIRMGELSVKPFIKECKQRYPASRTMEKAAPSFSEWQEYIQDPEWHPFKVIEIEGKGNEVCMLLLSFKFSVQLRNILQSNIFRTEYTSPKSKA